MAKVDSFNFGTIVVEGKKYSHDILLFPDGVVNERRSGFWKFGSHAIQRNEIERLITANPEVVIVGTGTSGRARLTSDAKSYAKEAKVELVVLPSAEAIESLNRLVEGGKRVAALIHITC
jgi:hypothetical protein